MTDADTTSEDSTADRTTDAAAIGATDPDRLGFAATMAELERIVAELDSESLDVDLLADRVERAAVLVTWCRERIDGTRFRVEEILDRLE